MIKRINNFLKKIFYAKKESIKQNNNNHISSNEKKKKTQYFVNFYKNGVCSITKGTKKSGDVYVMSFDRIIKKPLTKNMIDCIIKDINSKTIVGSCVPDVIYWESILSRLYGSPKLSYIVN